MAHPAFPLPFEQIRWRRRRFALSDFRFVALKDGRVTHEIAVHDIDGVEIKASLIERLTGVGTLVVRSTRTGDHQVRIPGLRAARREALTLDLLIAETRGLPPPDTVGGLPLSSFWPVPISLRAQVVVAGPLLVLMTFVAIGIGLSGHTVPVIYPADDAIRPGGARRPEAEIIAFMEHDVMPWASRALAPVVGRGVTCETCHGRNAAARGWTMPAVRALPEPAVRAMAEAAGSDAQVRNALHGYLAEGDNQAVAAYMRGVVMPGMAMLLRRPAYEFAQSYEYNRSRAAFGCYHCHQVGGP
jgi:Bacterial PH domain